MRRRQFIAGLGSAAAWPMVARAQQGERMRRIGVLTGTDENNPLGKLRLPAFTQALADLGWIVGRDLRMDVRSTGGDTNRTRALARELVGLQPDIILAGGTPTTAALQRETRTIPIVFVNVGDPVASGIVASLNQPGGNITGFAVLEASLSGKWLELLSDIAPGLKRAAILFNPETAPGSLYVPSFEAAARSLNVVPIIAPVHSDVEIETAIKALGGEPRGGLVIFKPALLFNTLTTSWWMAGTHIVYYSVYGLFATWLQTDFKVAAAVVAMPILFSNIQRRSPGSAGVAVAV